MSPFRSALRSLLLLVVAVPLVQAQTNPVPLINNPLVPASVPPGSAALTLTVNGTGFVPGSVVNWNQTPLTTTFVSSSQLLGTVTANLIAQQTVANVSVTNPAPGGGVSNEQLFQAGYPTGTAMTANSALPGTISANAVASADFNGDGKPDLAGASSNPNNPFSNGLVQISINNGNGTFKTAVQYTTNILPDAIGTGDFNGDGVQDLAVANACGTDPNCQTAGTVSVLLGNGDGTFASAINYACAQGADWVVTADFNRDGKLDFAVAGTGISVFLGNGDGTFQPAVTYIPAFFYESIAVGDLDGNGVLDLVYAYTPNDQSNGSVGVLLGNGDGTFSSGPISAALIAPWGLVLADFNGDGKLDAAVVDEISALLQVYLGNGDGTLQNPQNFPLGGQGFGLTSADFNADGKMDLLGYASGSGEPLLLGNGDGTFQPWVNLLSGAFGSEQMAVRDFNGDGKLDLATGQNSSNSGSDVQFQTTALVSPSALNFPVTQIGKTSRPLTVTLTNVANSPLRINKITITGTDSADFAENSNCGTAVPPGASCTINVEFTPMISGFLTASLSISDSSHGSPQIVMLTGKVQR